MVTTVADGTHYRVAPETQSPREPERGHIGLVVLGSIVFGVALALLLVFVAFAAGSEGEITGSVLVAIGAWFIVLALASRRFTDQPQAWALPPGIAFVAVGLGLIVLSPSDHVFRLAGWVWPVLVLAAVGWSVRGARRSLHNWSRRALLYPVFAVLLLAAIGGAVETILEATADDTPTGGRTYVVNGHRLYMNCLGQGAPTVVLFNGMGERTSNWAWVQKDVSSTTRVCAFDRAGQGWSSNGPARQDGREMASDLHGLLGAAQISGPYVLAGHSTGGTYGLVYAAQYPGEVGGVALIDSSTPYQFELPDYPDFYSMWRRVSALLPPLSRTGIARPTLGSGFTGLPPEARDEVQKFASSPRELRANNAEFLELRTVFDQAKELTTLGNKPLAVLTAELEQQKGWPVYQDKLAQLSTNSVHKTVSGSTHETLLEDQGFASVTSQSIIDVVERQRGAAL